MKIQCLQNVIFCETVMQSIFQGGLIDSEWVAIE